LTRRPGNWYSNVTLWHSLRVGRCRGTLGGRWNARLSIVARPVLRGVAGGLRQPESGRRNGAHADPAAGAENPYQPTPYIKLKHPEWAKNAVIYQINTRQFTPEGTFRAAEAHLSRLDYFGGEAVELDAATRLELKPWGYKVFVK
jgi:hypothetical protein